MFTEEELTEIALMQPVKRHMNCWGIKKEELD